MFGRFSRGRPHQDPPSSAPPIPSDMGIWGASLEVKAPSSGSPSTSSTPESKDKKKKDKCKSLPLHCCYITPPNSEKQQKTLFKCIPLVFLFLAVKDGSPRLKKTYSTKESKSKRKSAAAGIGSAGSEVKAQSTTSSSSTGSNLPASEEVAPEDVNVTRRGKKCPQNVETAGECCHGRHSSSQRPCLVYSVHVTVNKF